MAIVLDLFLNNRQHTSVNLEMPESQLLESSNHLISNKVGLLIIRNLFIYFLMCLF